MDVIENLGKGEEGVGDVHAHENSVADKSEVERITPSGKDEMRGREEERERTDPTSQRVTIW